MRATSRRGRSFIHQFRELRTAFRDYYQAQLEAPMLEDIDALPPEFIGEIIDGVLYTRNRPSPAHQFAAGDGGSFPSLLSLYRTHLTLCPTLPAGGVIACRRCR